MCGFIVVIIITLDICVSISISSRTIARQTVLNQARQNKHRLCIWECYRGLVRRTGSTGNSIIFTNLKHRIRSCLTICGRFLHNIRNGIVFGTIFHCYSISRSVTVSCHIFKGMICGCFCYSVSIDYSTNNRVNIEIIIIGHIAALRSCQTIFVRGHISENQGTGNLNTNVAADRCSLRSNGNCCTRIKCHTNVINDVVTTVDFADNSTVSFKVSVCSKFRTRTCNINSSNFRI